MVQKIVLGAVLIGLCLGSQLAASAGPNLEQAESLLRGKRAQEAYDLLEPFEFDMAGDLKYDYLLGLAALESGKPEKSSLVFERVLAMEPRYLGVRLDLARSYFQIGDLARATQEFQTVLAQNPPPDLKANAERHLKAIEQATAPRQFSLNAYVEAGVGHDDNVNSSTADNPINLPAFNNQPLFLDQSNLKRGDNYASVGVGAEVGYVLTPRWSVYAGGDVRSRNHRDVKTANYGTLDGRLGVGLNLGQHFLRMGAANGRFFLDRRAYRDTLGGNAEWRYQANDRDQFTFNAQYTSFRLTQEALQTSDFDQAMASLSWLHVLASGSTLFALSVNAGDESPIGRRADGAARINGARVFAQTALTSQIGLFTSLGTQNTKYENVNDTFLLKRDDRLSDITIGLNWRIGKDWSIRPQATYMKNSANIPLYSFTRSDVALNLRKEFH